MYLNPKTFPKIMVDEIIRINANISLNRFMACLPAS